MDGVSITIFDLIVTTRFSPLTHSLESLFSNQFQSIEMSIICSFLSKKFKKLNSLFDLSKLQVLMSSLGPGLETRDVVSKL